MELQKDINEKIFIEQYLSNNIYNIEEIFMNK